MFKIGDFSKLSRVPVKTLRYYDEIGLLKPVGVDRFTRYRYYSPDQLIVLNRILGLKELGFSLEQIAQLLESDLSPEQLRRMLVRRQEEIRSQIETEQEILKRIENRLREIEQEGKLRSFEIVLKELQAQWVASSSQVIPSYAEAEVTFAALFDQLSGFITASGVRTPGARLAMIYDQDQSGENLQIEAAVQLPAPLPSFGSVTVYQLPAVLAACLVYPGIPAMIGQAYSAIFSWMQENTYRAAGPARELYLRVDTQGDAQGSIIEIQYPVRKLKEHVIMEPKIVLRDQFYVVGLPYIGDNAHDEIKEMWGVFNQRYAEIRHVLDDSAAYGLCYDKPGQGMEYIAGYQVTELADIPHGMVGKVVPSQTYVVFACRGLENIGKTYHKIIHEWLPENGYVPGGGPDFEYYDQDFDPQTASGTMYIYFPIQKA